MTRSAASICSDSQGSRCSFSGIMTISKWPSIERPCSALAQEDAVAGHLPGAPSHRKSTLIREFAKQATRLIAIEGLAPRSVLPEEISVEEFQALEQAAAQVAVPREATVQQPSDATARVPPVRDLTVASEMEGAAPSAASSVATRRMRSGSTFSRFCGASSEPALKQRAVDGVVHACVTSWGCVLMISSSGRVPDRVVRTPRDCGPEDGSPIAALPDDPTVTVDAPSYFR